MADLSALQDRLGCSFKHQQRLIAAITHTSYSHEHPDSMGPNERLEFLGDTVLNLVVSEALFLNDPPMNEGDLSKTRAAIVNESVLAEVAQKIGLGSFLLLGAGEEKSGGREKPSILADALEAVIAAIYLEKGLNGAKRFILTAFADPLQGYAAGILPVDYKTCLQELCQKQFESRPVYHLMGESGPGHQKQFEVEVTVGRVSYGRGCGQSKKAAEQEAAQIALLALTDERATQ